MVHINKSNWGTVIQIKWSYSEREKNESKIAWLSDHWKHLTALKETDG